MLWLFEAACGTIARSQRLANVAVDAVFDSESIGTTFQKELQEAMWDRSQVGYVIDVIEQDQRWDLNELNLALCGENKHQECVCVCVCFIA